jgi:protease-4
MSRPMKWFLVLIVLAVVLSVAGLVAVFAFTWKQQSVPQQVLLELRLRDPLPEQIGGDPFSELLEKDRMRLRDLVAALDAAAKDDRVVGLIADVTPADLGMAQIDEVRDAVLAFRASGKPAIAYTDTFGEVVPANGAYYLASAFDEVYIQPSGDVGLTGVQLTSTFFRGTLEKLGVTPEFAQRYEYKNAMNTFTHTEFTPEHEAAMDSLAGSIWGHMTARIAEARKIPAATLQALVDQGPLLGQAAVDAKLVDGLLYREQVYERARERAGADDAELLYVHKYWKRTENPWHGGERTIALVYGLGAVVRGESQTDLFGGTSMGSETVAAAIRKAVEDDDVAAIVLRIDSPGGSYVASDTIWHEVVRAREAGKPVIVSMGDYAASGGYFAAIAADKIVAQPMTLTGSIGVLGGKFVTTEMWPKIGVTFDSVQRGEHAEMWSTTDAFDPDEWAKFNAWLDRVYTDFTTKVAQGRNLPIERVREIAKGRVWSGLEAKRLGLVDELGGYTVALRLAREAAGIGPNTRVQVREYPRAKGPFEEIFEESPDSSDAEGAQARALVATVRALRELAPLVEVLREAGVMERRDPATLRMPPVEVR